MSERLLAIDVGAGTQDILLFETGQPIENSIKLVLPSPTVIKAEEIAEATNKGEDLFISGQLMGGGANTKAIKDHLSAGYDVYASPQAAKTINDNLEVVSDLGIEIVERPPQNREYQQVEFGDLKVDQLADSLANFGVKLPDKYAVAVQDHGESLTESDRKFRFKHWKRFVKSGGRIEELSYLEIPDYLTRMQAVKETAAGKNILLMDTGAAAIRGALCDKQVAARKNEGIIVVNIGNLHTLGFLIKGNRVWGLFEHHTSLLNSEKLQNYIQCLRKGKLTNQEVYNDSGHGAYIEPELPAGDFSFVAVTGPNRQLADSLDYYFAVPYGDMMLSGCFGLLAAARDQSMID